MSLLDIGYLAGLLTTAALLPQLVRNWRLRSAAQISWAYLAAFAAGVALWFVYGAIRADVALMTTNAVTFALVLSLVYLKATRSDDVETIECASADPDPASDAHLVVRAAGFLFDLDGVLVDSTASVEKHWREIAAEVGVDATELLQRVHGRRSIDVIKELTQGTGLDAGWLYQSLIDRDRRDHGDIVALPGARCTLENLPRNRWAVVTSGTRDVAIARLHAASLPLPVVMVTADDVPAGKPDPSPYQIGAAALGLDTRDCLVIEDSPPGVQSAWAAGCRTLALLTTHSRDDLVRADLAGTNLAAFSLELVH